MKPVTAKNQTLPGPWSTTRSGKSLDVRRDKNKFADRIRILADEGQRNSSDLKKGKFSAAHLANWATECRENIRNKIALKEMIT